ncbi:hypothetical protein BH11MYX1_BH11MYX1_04980 [soil metagenome]
MYRVQPVKYLWLTTLILGCDFSKSAEDRRPLTAEYVTETILKPSCGTAECHSAMKQQNGYIFDSVAGLKYSARVIDTGLVQTCESLGVPDIATCVQTNFDVQNSLLILSITNTPGLKQMPFDQPMSNQDVALLTDWIQAGAEGLDLP